MSKSAPTPTLEAAMERLESIVREMEAGDLPLETLLEKYEEGMGLSRLCQEKLLNAEERIKILSRDTSGNPVLEDFETNDQD